MPLTRRDVTKMALAGPALAIAPLPAVGQSRRQLAAQLQRDLDSHLIPGCDGALILKAFDAGRWQGQIRMAAIVQLDWPPGKSRRRFDSFGDDPDAAYASLLNQTLFSFAKAWPGCVV